MDTEYVQVITTVASKKDADRLARHLVKQRLAGCVQVSGPISSFYHWQGNLEEDQEFQLLIKSRSDLFAALAEEIKGNHPYETPEILSVPIIAGSEEYLGWLDKELRTAT